MNREQIQSWLSDVQRDLLDLEATIAPLLRERSRMEERHRLLEGLLASFDLEAERGAGGDEIPAAGQGPLVHDSVVAHVAQILSEEGGPLHINEIHARFREKGYRVPGAGKPVNLTAHVRRSSLFVSPKRGIYVLAEGGADRPAAPTKRRPTRRRH